MNTQNHNKIKFDLHIAISQSLNNENIATRYCIVSKILYQKGIKPSLRNKESQTY